MARGTVSTGGIPTPRQTHERLERDVTARRMALEERMAAHGYRQVRCEVNWSNQHPLGGAHAEDRFVSQVDALLSDRIGAEQRARGEDAAAAEFGTGRCGACGGPRVVHGMSNPETITHLADIDAALEAAGWKRSRRSK